MITPKLAVLAFAISLLASNNAFAKLKIPMGEREVLTTVYDLPESDAYQIKDGAQEVYIDLATLHKEYNIGYILPLYITQEPILVGYSEKQNAYYELTDEQLKTIAKVNKIDTVKVNKLSFYTRYGGKLVATAILALVIYGFISGKKKKIESKHI